MTHQKNSLILLLVALICFGPLLIFGLTSWSVSTDTLPSVTAYGTMLLNSLVVAGGTTLLVLLVSIPISFVLFRLQVPGRSLFVGIIIAAAFMPLPIYASSWLGAFGIDILPFRLRVEQGGTGQTIQLVQAILIMGLAKAPLGILLTGLSQWGIDPRIEESAWLETSRGRVLYHVVLRYILSGSILTGSVIFGLSLGEITVTDMLGIRTLAEECYNQFQLTLDPSKAVGVAMGVFLPILLPWGILLARWRAWTMRPLGAVYTSTSAVFTKVPKKVLGMAVFIVVLFLVFLFVVPITVLLMTAESFPVLWAKIGVALPELRFSLWVSTLASMCAVLVALPFAFCIRGKRWAMALVAIGVMGFFVPGTVLGISLVKIFNHGGVLGVIYNSPIVLVIGLALRYFPLALILLVLFLKSSPKIYEEMAQVDRSSFLQTMIYVYVPLVFKPLLGVWLLTMLWCLGDLDVSILICPPGPTTLPIRLFTMMHYGIYADVAATCLLLISTISVCATGILLLCKSSVKRKYHEDE